MYSPCPRASGGGVSVICLVTSQSIGGMGVKCKINTVRLQGRPNILNIEWELWGCTVMVIGMMGEARDFIALYVLIEKRFWWLLSFLSG